MSFAIMRESCSTRSDQDAMQIPTFLLGVTWIARAGLGHILSGTCFQIQEHDIDFSSDCPGLPDSDIVLFILERTQSANETFEIIERLKEHCATARIVVLDDSLEMDFIVPAYDAGVAGVLSRPTVPDILVKSLELVVLGERLFPAAPILSAIKNGLHFPGGANQNDGSARSPDASILEARNLSGREHEILRLLTEGAPNKVIARRLGVAEATVKVHIKAILRKIRAQNRTQAAMWATTHLQPGSKASAGQL
jgi:two-component system nitrate/nitrite response regulator NarL